MIANIIPIKRLPTHLLTFTYRVPEELIDRIAVGQLVTIPFRQSIIFGLVLSLEKRNDEALKPIESLYVTEAMLSQHHFNHIHTVSEQYGVSPGTAAKMMLPPLQKRKLKKIELTPLAKPKPCEPQKTSFFKYNTEQEHAVILSEKVNGKTLILVPEVQYIERILNLLSDEQRDIATTWHSQLSTKEQFARWTQVRNSEKTITIGTRGACFLAFPELDTIIVDYEHHDQHKHWDQAPRVHAKDMSTWLAKMYGATEHFLSFSPSCASYFGVHKKFIEGSIGKPEPIDESVQIIDMSEERRAGRFTLLSDTVKNALRTAKGDIFLFIQRRGFSTSVGCNACGFIAQCSACQLPYIFHEKTNSIHCHYCRAEKTMMQSCPKCKATAVVLRGAGTEFLESGIRSFFQDDSTKNIIRIDGDQEFESKGNDESQRIVIGTEMAFQHIRWKKTDTIIYVDIDKQLSIPEYLSAEHVWHMLAEIQYEKNSDAMLYIQTSNPQQTVLRGLTEPDRFYRTELNARKSFGYPPYKYLVRYFFGGQTQIGVEKEVKHVQTTLSAALTKEKRSPIISPPVEMHPRYYRTKFWYTFLVKLDPKTVSNDLRWINNHIGSSWKIDPNPINILHP